MSQNQEAAAITVLRFPENVRMRKEMYLYSPDHCVFEIIDNSVDEHSAGYCDEINVSIIDDVITVQDNGRGIPVAPHPDPEYAGLSQAEVALTILHAGKTAPVNSNICRKALELLETP